MNKKWTTAGIALALGVMWTAAPVLAQQTTGEKLEDKSRRAGDKLERGADKTGDKLHKAADKTESKTERAKDKMESAWDKTKDKARDLKDKVKDKTSDLKDKASAKIDRMAAKTEKADVMAMQQALKDKGHDPGPADGRMGPRTKAALMDYQKKEGLQPTGRWDDQTATKLGVRVSDAKPEVSTSPSPPPPPSTSAPAAANSPVGTSIQPPATPEDKTAPAQKRSAP